MLATQWENTDFSNHLLTQLYILRHIIHLLRFSVVSPQNEGIEQGGLSFFQRYNLDYVMI